MSHSPRTPVWIDPDFADLLVEDPELVAIADAVQQTRAARPARRRPRAGRLGAAATAIGAVTAVVLLAPWSHGSQAAVLARIRSALTPRPGWILYQRDVTRQIEVPNGRPVTVVSERWTRFAPPYSFRTVIRKPGSRSLEEGGTYQPGRAFVFDPATNSLYRDDRLIVRTGTDVPRDLAGELRSAVAAGDAAIAGHVTVNGRTLLRIVPTTPQRYGPWVDYVDARTFRPVRFESSGLPVRGKDGIPHPSTSVITITAYRYLPPTTLNVRLGNIRARHPRARVAAASAMPARLRAEVTP